MYLTGTFSVRPFRISFRNRRFEKDFVVVVDARVSSQSITDLSQ